MKVMHITTIQTPDILVTLLRLNSMELPSTFTHNPHMPSIANAYDWIIATAASRINRRICTVINTVNNVCLIDGPLFPSSVNNKCPAIIQGVPRGMCQTSGECSLC